MHTLPAGQLANRAVWVAGADSRVLFNLAGRKFTNWFVIPLQFATIMITLATCGILGGQALQVTDSALLNAEPTMMPLPTSWPPNRNPPACQVHGISVHLKNGLNVIAPSKCWQNSQSSCSRLATTQA